MTKDAATPDRLSDEREDIVVLLRRYARHIAPELVRRAANEIERLRAVPSRDEVLRKALQEISAKKYEHRDTVSEAAAWRHFQTLNKEVCKILDIADRALSQPSGKEGE